MTNLIFKLFTFQGTPVNLNLLFLIIFIITPIPIAVSIFISVILHEMAHAFVANRRGYRVYGIEVGLFSGSASIDSNMHERDAIPITAAGPISNLILYFIGMVVSFVYPNTFIDSFMMVNLFLFIFNILPIYPMDGGRILRDLLSIKSRKLGINRGQAFSIAAKVSLVTSVLLIIVSVMSGFLFMALFGAYFGYLALKDLGIIKN
jgi:stage IV sporulation protein FB